MGPIVILVFLLGASVGTFINRCVRRLPYEQSLLWPGSRCTSCFQRARWYSAIPLLGYWLARGRCSVCGTPFPFRVCLVEVGLGATFVGLFYLEIVQNALQIPLLSREHSAILLGQIPVAAWVIFGWHALLLCLLLTASLCDLEHMEIPLVITFPGTLIGLLGASLLAWPYPEALVPLQRPTLFQPVVALPNGLYPWPVWHDLPSWLPQGSWQLGLLTGLAGAFTGMIMLRAIRFLFGLGRGMEGLGIGDADLMMMAGSFVGWQIVLVAFFVAVFPALFLGIAQVALRGDQAMPFGPPLAAGVLVTLLTWPAVGGHFRPLFNSPEFLAILGGLGAVFLLGASFLLRLVRGTPESPR